jgi:hypothetical protein
MVSYNCIVISEPCPILTIYFTVVCIVYDSDKKNDRIERYCLLLYYISLAPLRHDVLRYGLLYA